MKHVKTALFLIVIASMILAACGAPSPAPTATPLPSATNTQVPPTNTPNPTVTIVDPTDNWVTAYFQQNEVVFATINQEHDRMFVVSILGDGGFVEKNNPFSPTNFNIEHAQFASDGSVVSSARQWLCVDSGTCYEMGPPLRVAGNNTHMFATVSDGDTTSIWAADTTKPGLTKLLIGAYDPQVSGSGDFLTYITEDGEVAITNLRTHSQPKVLGKSWNHVWSGDMLYFANEDHFIVPMYFGNEITMTPETCTAPAEVASLAIDGENEYFSTLEEEIFYCDGRNAIQLDVPSGEVVGIFRPSVEEIYLIISTREGLIATDIE